MAKENFNKKKSSSCNRGINLKLVSLINGIWGGYLYESEPWLCERERVG